MLLQIARMSSAPLYDIWVSEHVSDIKLKGDGRKDTGGEREGQQERLHPWIKQVTGEVGNDV